MKKKSSVNHYKQRIDRHLKLSQNLKKQLLWSSFLRLAVFLIFAVGIIWFWGDFKVVIVMFIAFLVLFLVLVNRHQKLKRQREMVQRLIEINEHEIKALAGDVSMFNPGKRYKDEIHLFSADLDLFSDGGFFQHLNRTATTDGEATLAKLVLSNAISKIEEKQEAVKELAQKIQFRQAFTAEALSVKQAVTQATIKQWFKTYKAFMPSMMRWFPLAFTGLSAVVILLFFSDVITMSQLGLWALIGLGMTGFYLKRTQKLSSDINQLQTYFANQHHLVKRVENENFDSTVLQSFKALVATKDQNLSKDIQVFNKLIDAFEQRNNFLLGFFFNAFMLWDLRYVYLIERWVAQHHDQLEHWFTCLNHFDAYHSLANFAFNHPHFSYPVINPSTSNLIIEAKEAVHPLLPKNEAITNSYQLSVGDFWIVTGANMAGKSTFLRTVGLQILMSNLGLPVSAASSSYQPMPIITSMRTADSLKDESSYFYAELSRLKMIIDTIKTQPHFIILDEILKGTNSKDKAEGSKKFIEKLNRTTSVGVIATHDISLCDLAAEHQELHNYHFDAEIIKDELYFDYQLKPGVCKNMNASFLMQKMDIT